MAEKLQIAIERIPANRLVLLEGNPRFMPSHTYRQLVDNIRRDGVLTSLPLVYPLEDGNYEVLSGNHRVMAARDAGITDEIDCIVIKTPISDSRKRAIAISHNQIVGQDDPQRLKDFYNSIAEVNWRAYSGVDEEAVNRWLDSITIPPLPSVDLRFQVFTMLFLPEEAEELEKSWETLVAFARQARIARLSDYEPWVKLVTGALQAYGVKNTATAVRLITDIAKSHILDLRQGYLDDQGNPKHSEWVPVDTFIGTDVVPAASAAVINKALEKAIACGDCNPKSRWTMLEMWAADYLAGK